MLRVLSGTGSINDTKSGNKATPFWDGNQHMRVEKTYTEVPASDERITELRNFPDSIFALKLAKDTELLKLAINDKSLSSRFNLTVMLIITNKNPVAGQILIDSNLTSLKDPDTKNQLQICLNYNNRPTPFAQTNP